MGFPPSKSGAMTSPEPAFKFQTVSCIDNAMRDLELMTKRIGNCTEQLLTFNERVHGSAPVRAASPQTKNEAHVAPPSAVIPNLARQLELLNDSIDRLGEELARL